MALHRGIQSAIFYYLSCAPCSDARYRKKRKKEAQRDRLDKAELGEQMPDLYQHPSPSSTNPHWNAEIALGPAPSSRGGRRKATPTSERQRGTGGLRPSTTQSSSSGSRVASSTHVNRMWTPDDRNDSKNSFGQHQRRDEDRWGSTATDTALRSFLDGSSNGNGPTMPLKAHTRDPPKHHAPPNPSINDLHPATVTKLSSREEVAWLLQPPPIAEVMSGKASPMRSASGSMRSRPSVRSSRLSRQTSERLTEDRPVLGAANDLDTSPQTATDPSGQRHDRGSGTSTTDERDFAISSTQREKRRPAPLHLKDPSQESEVTVIHRPSLAPEPVRVRPPRKIASRPQLSTIFSDNIAPSDIDPYDTPSRPRKAENSVPSARGSEASSGERDRISRRPPILVNDSPLKLLQDIDPKASIFNTRIFAGSPAIETRVRLPAVDGEEENRLTGGPEFFDNWTPDLDLSEWVHEQTKRPGVKHRWSMDL